MLFGKGTTLIASSAKAVIEHGAIEALMELLTCHKHWEDAERLIEALLNSMKIRVLKVEESAITPLSQYFLDKWAQASDSTSKTSSCSCTRGSVSK